jgi:hypothetical protein
MRIRRPGDFYLRAPAEVAPEHSMQCQNGPSARSAGAANLVGGFPPAAIRGASTGGKLPTPWKLAGSGPVSISPSGITATKQPRFVLFQRPTICLEVASRPAADVQFVPAQPCLTALAQQVATREAQRQCNFFLLDVFDVVGGRVKRVLDPPCNCSRRREKATC